MDCKEAGDMTLSRFFRENPRAALGFSGGVDSAYLLYAALTAGAQVKAYYVKSPFQPRFELEDAPASGGGAGGGLGGFGGGPFGGPSGGGESSQPVLFLQKDDFWTDCRGRPARRLLLASGRHQRLGRRWGPARDSGSPGAVGSLSSSGMRPHQGQDSGAFPGGEALHLGQAGLCLSSSCISHGDGFDVAPVGTNGAGEDALTALGFRNFRVRYLDGRAKIQVTEEQMALALEKRQEILAALRSDYTEVLLDLEVRHA